MSLARNHFTKWIFMLFLSLITLSLLYSSLHARWTVVTPPIAISDREFWGVHFTSADEGWAVGYDGPNRRGALLLYQGGTWSSVTPPTVSADWQLWGIHFTSADEGWAVGWDIENRTGVLLHYQNGIWTKVTPSAMGSGWDLSGVHFTSANEGWAVGAGGTGVLLHYQNGTWSSVTPPTVSDSWYLTGVYFTSVDEGWAVGYDVENGTMVLLHYQNGDWTKVTPPTASDSRELKAVHFTSVDEGWAVGSEWVNSRGALIHYKNGTWTVVTPPTVGRSWYLKGVYFTSADEGWAVGTGGDFSYGPGVLLHYKNGTWTVVTPPTMSDRWWLNGIHFTSADEGWAVGIDANNRIGSLLHYDTFATLTIDKSGKGTGGVISDPSGINCGLDCTETFTEGQSITLTATPDLGSFFGGWSGGGCSATNTCVVTMTNDFSVTALFNPPLSTDAGTIGTQLTVSNSSLGSKKGKVLIGNTATKIITWTNTSITAEISKALPLEQHDVVVRPKEPKGALPITYQKAFTMMAPEISFSDSGGDSGMVRDVIGSFFSTKKGKVYLEDPTSGTKKNCKVTYWYMDPATGTSELRFVVPKLSKSFLAGIYSLKVTNKVGTTQTTFTVGP